MYNICFTQQEKNDTICKSFIKGIDFRGATKVSWHLIGTILHYWDHVGTLGHFIVPYFKNTNKNYHCF